MALESLKEVLAERFWEDKVLREDADVDLAVTVKDNSSLDEFVGWALKVVWASTTTVWPNSTLLGMKMSFNVLFTTLENLKHVEFTASRPAVTWLLGNTILGSAGNSRVQTPDSRHVAIEIGSSVVIGHGEFKDKDFAGTSKSLCIRVSKWRFSGSGEHLL